MTDAAIAARDVHKRFGAVHALSGLTLTVPRGAIFGLLGENGAGKTTFIKVLLDIVRPTSGDVTVLEHPPGAIPARRRIGYLPENLQLPPAISAVGFLHSAGRLKGLSRSERDVQIPRVLKAVGLQEAFWDKRTGGFSKGMRQRTGLAGALLGDPELLVLDEPTDGIDPLGRAELREVIRAASRNGATVFLNSHLLAETEKIADHVAVLAKGKVVLSGALDLIRADDRYLVTFAEHPKVVDLAHAAGFAPSDDANGTPNATTAAFIFSGAHADELSDALQKALISGLKVRSVRPLTKDLETVMADAVGRGDP